MNAEDLRAIPVLHPLGDEQLEALARPMMKNGYGQYLARMLKERVY